MMTQQRLSLDAITVGVCQAVRSWVRSGLVGADKVDPVLLSPFENESSDWMREPLEEYQQDEGVESSNGGEKA